MNRRLSAGRYACLLFVLLGLGAASGAALAGQLWQDIDETRLSVQAADRLIVPQRYRSVQLDLEALRSQLEHAPAQFTAGPRASATLPLPYGGLLDLLVENSPIMEPELAARHPGIRTFRVYGAKRPDVSGRMGWTRAGLHAIVFTPEGTIYIDPYSRGDTQNYITYYRHDFGVASEQAFSCGGAFSDHGEPGRSGIAMAGIVTSGDTLRTYRLAMAANYEYTQFHSGPLPALADKTLALNNGIIPAVNRVNGIYERDFAVNLVLVAGEEDIIFDNPGDPYVNEDGISMLATNPTVIDGIIGVNNYDVGHVFSTGGGGVAGLGVVCRTGAGVGHKANGVTGLPAPTNDPFYVDYVAHEVGHQFGGNHTFNGSTGSCSGGNRNGPTAYEVGSGTTIMAYAGICSPQNTQSNSDDLFHHASLQEIVNYITNAEGDDCPAKTPTGNTPPFVDAGPDFTIPRSTPFRLTATGGDADGDTVTYAWEEYDLGPAGDSNTDNGSWPLFRAFNTVSSPVRVMPQNAEKPFGPFPYGETLPTTNRTMKFRVTIRDNRAGGGGFAWDEMSATVTTAADFSVERPVDVDVWTANDTETVLWTMAGTDVPPIDTQFVDILLSTDGGENYDIVLASGVPNDGVQEVSVPALETSEAVVQVAAVDNIYFEISQGVFDIVLPADIDNDGIANESDNCPNVANADQANSDADAVGDACDNCIEADNPTQCDTNGDGYGNHCDADLNDNGVINFSDLGDFKMAVFSTPGDANWNPDADMTCNDVVNFTDLAVMKETIFGPPGPSAFAP